MRRFGLIGYPLGHSFSKKYFTRKFENENLMDCSYQNFEIDAIEKFPLLLKNNPLLHGLNVTIPYKQSIIAYLDELDETAQRVNAVNTIQFKNGKWIGCNTDVIGFEQTFLPLVKPHHSSAIVLGSGGASKAVEFILRKIGINYLVVSRKPTQNQIGYDELNDFMIERFKVIINCTPLGMYPNENDCPPMPYSFISPHHLCYDLIYNPAETLFLKKCMQQQATVQNGLPMLLSQAEAAWKIWTL